MSPIRSLPPLPDSTATTSESAISLRMARLRQRDGQLSIWIEGAISNNKRSALDVSSWMCMEVYRKLSHYIPA